MLFKLQLMWKGSQLANRLEMSQVLEFSAAHWIPSHPSPDPQTLTSTRLLEGLLLVLFICSSNIYWASSTSRLHVGSDPAVDKTTFVFTAGRGVRHIKHSEGKERQDCLSGSREEGCRWYLFLKMGGDVGKEDLGQTSYVTHQSKTCQKPLPQSGESQENARCVFSLLYSRPLSSPYFLTFTAISLASSSNVWHSGAYHSLNCVFPCPIPNHMLKSSPALAQLLSHCGALCDPGL